MKSIEISARTVAEAIQLALAQLGKDRDEVAIEVLEAGSDDEEAFVRVTVVDDEDEATAAVQEEAPPAQSSVDQIARRILEDLLERMDIHAYVTVVRSSVPDQRGEMLRSLQFMVNLLVSRKVQKWPQVVVDVGNYRQRRQESLEGLARRMAERVRQSGRALTLEPMGAYERRIVHLALRSDPSVYTESTGEGENRKVVIYPAKS